MSTFCLHTELYLTRPRVDIFAFFPAPHNLEKLTPWLHFQILNPGTLEMRQGVLIDHRLRVHAIPLHSQSVVTVWEPPNRFVDSQTRGSYRLWIAIHSFSDTRT